MRVTGGAARGTPLLAPKSGGTRPTTDRVREAIFSILYSSGADLGAVLDLYAGTGALAIEALSRGDGRADLVERAPAACAVIRRNLERAGLTGRARLYCADVVRTLDQLNGPYTTVFLDPPYAEGLLATATAALAAAGWIAPAALVVAESAAAEATPAPPGFAPLAERMHGPARLSVFRAP